jgi:hypothetical protein
MCIRETRSPWGNSHWDNLELIGPAAIEMERLDWAGRNKMSRLWLV